MTLSIGLLLPTREMVMSKQESNFAQIIDMSVQAEASGFDAVWAGDSILARPRFEPLTTLAAVAARTQKIKVGTAVVLPALRNPVVLANEVANLDLISQGRVILGMGSAANMAANRKEFEAIGVSFQRRVGIFEESIEVMQRLWREPEVRFSGRNFNLGEVSLGLRPYSDGGIPVWLSASEDNSFRRVLRFGQGWFILAANAAAFSTAWRRLQELAAEEGRDVSGLGRGVYVTLDIDDDMAAAEARQRQFVESYYNGPFEELAKMHALCAGPPERCIRWLQDFVDAGANTLVIRFNRSDQAGQLRRFSEEIMRALR